MTAMPAHRRMPGRRQCVHRLPQALQFGRRLPAPWSYPDLSAKPGTSSLVGRDIDGGNIDEPGRFRPMTEAEMEAELDAIEAEDADEDIDESGPDLVEALILRANELRAEGSIVAARHLLYRVLEDGDDDQRRVARNILADLDQD
jgi:sec-independent protein translocase protein TatC